MNKQKKAKIYKTAIYVRLSREDGDVAGHLKDESDSISNQKSLISHYMSQKEELSFYEMYEDDGFSGVFMDRPGFLAMQKDIIAGKIDCVIVKDLSRLGRNYVEVGRTVEEFLDVYGVRIIAINDGIDTMDGDEKVREFIIPFLNIMYEQYARDTSYKTRGSLDTKRREGQFIGSFAPYGYKKEQGQVVLQIDPEAAKVVKSIFKSYIAGYNAIGIAKRLNEQHILTPMDYKRKHGIRYGNGFRIYNRGEWDAQMILRILKNEVYIGNLVQGKVSKKNYKQKKRYNKQSDKWIRVEGTHEAIVDRGDFEVVQQLLSEDSKKSPGKERLYPLAGKLYCGDCGEPLHRRAVSNNGKKYFYYGCAANKRDKNMCTQHNISERILIKAVLEAVKLHVRTLLDMKGLVQFCTQEMDETKLLETLEVQKMEVEDQIQKYTGRLRGLYEDVKDALITKTEYTEYKSDYTDRIFQLKQRLTEIDKKIANQMLAPEDTSWIDRFEQYACTEELDRTTVAQLIKRIDVYEGNRTKITFNFENEFKGTQEFIENSNVSTENWKEA